MEAEITKIMWPLMWLIVYAIGVISIIGFFGIVVIAWKNAIWKGLLCLFIPPLAIFYGFRHYKDEGNGNTKTFTIWMILPFIIYFYGQLALIEY